MISHSKVCKKVPKSPAEKFEKHKVAFNGHLSETHNALNDETYCHYVMILITKNCDHVVHRDFIFHHTTSVIYDIATFITTCIVEQIIFDGYNKCSVNKT